MEEELQSGLSTEEPAQGYQQWQFNQYEPPKQVPYRTNYVKCVVWGLVHRVASWFLASTVGVRVLGVIIVLSVFAIYGRDGYPDMLHCAEEWDYHRIIAESHMQVSVPESFVYHDKCGGWHESIDDDIRVFISHEDADAEKYQTKEDLDEYLDRTYRGYAKADTGTVTTVDGYTACVYNFEDTSRALSNGFGEVTVLYNTDTSEVYSFAVVSYVHDDEFPDIFKSFRESIKLIDPSLTVGNSTDWSYKTWASA